MRRTVCVVLYQHGRSLQPKRRDRSLAAARAPRGCDVERVLTSPPVRSGSDVIELQESLRALGLYDSAIDGVYGPRTQEAVQEFQQLVRSSPTGRQRGMGFADGRGAFY